jgi:hypothetical protein
MHLSINSVPCMSLQVSEPLETNGFVCTLKRPVPSWKGCLKIVSHGVKLVTSVHLFATNW